MGTRTAVLKFSGRMTVLSIELKNNNKTKMKLSHLPKINYSLEILSIPGALPDLSFETALSISIYVKVSSK